MHIALWIVQVLLAVVFLMAGGSKAVLPIDQLATNMAWVSEYPAWMARLAGVSEVLGALGLVLPSLLRIQPRLTAVAAGGLATVMALAVVVVHVPLGEYNMLVPNAVLGGLAAFVAWGRWSAAPIEARAARNRVGATS